MEESFGLHTGLRRPRRRILLWMIIAVCGLIVAVAAGLGGAYLLTQKQTEIPANIRQQVNFPLYLPEKLPDGYEIDGTSATLDEGVLVFFVTNNAGNKIIFSEQQLPNRNFKTFYKENITGYRELEGTTYESVLGNAPVKGKLLSVLADGTWLIISTTAPNGDALLEQIARSLQRQ